MGNDRENKDNKGYLYAMPRIQSGPATRKYNAYNPIWIFTLEAIFMK